MPRPSATPTTTWSASPPWIASSPEARPTARGGTPETLCLLLLALLGLSAAWGAGQAAVGQDFYQFWVVGLALGEPAAPGVYSDEGRARLGAQALERARREGDPRHLAVAEARATLETYSSPLLYAVFRWLASGHYETDFRNHRLLVLAGLTAGILVLCRVLGHSWGTALGALAVVSAWFAPFSSDLRVGGVNSLQLALLAAYLWTVARLRWRHREVLGGALLGLAVAFKPNLALVVVVLALDWALSRQGRRLGLHALGAGAGGLAAVAAAAATFGSWRCWIDWLAALGALPDRIVTVELGNFAPARVLAEGAGVEAGLPVGILLVALAIASSWRAGARARAGDPAAGAIPGAFRDATAVALGGLLVLLVPPLAWFHYHVLAVPALLVALCPAAIPRRIARVVPWQRVAVAVAFCGLALQPMLSLGIRPPALAEGVVVVLATVLLLVLTLLARAASRPGGPGCTLSPSTS